MKELLYKSATILLSVLLLLSICGCEDNKNFDVSSVLSLNDVSQQGSIVSSDQVAEKTSETSTVDNISSISSLQQGTTVVSSVSETSSSTVSSVNESEIEIEQWNTHTSAEIKSFIDWINKGVDSKKENAAFLSAMKMSGKILVPLSKKEELSEYSVDVNTNQSGYSYYWIIGKDTDDTSQLFQVSITSITDETKEYSLDDYYYAHSKSNGQLIKDGKWNDIEYHYTDYIENEKNEQISDSRCWFKYDENIVCISVYHSLRKKPFNPEYLNYFDYETVDLNIQN